MKYLLLFPSDKQAFSDVTMGGDPDTLKDYFFEWFLEQEIDVEKTKNTCAMGSFMIEIQPYLSDFCKAVASASHGSGKIKGDCPKEKCVFNYLGCGSCKKCKHSIHKSTKEYDNYKVSKYFKDYLAG